MRNVFKYLFIAVVAVAGISCQQRERNEVLACIGDIFLCCRSDIDKWHKGVADGYVGSISFCQLYKIIPSQPSVFYPYIIDGRHIPVASGVSSGKGRII